MAYVFLSDGLSHRSRRKTAGLRFIGYIQQPRIWILPVIPRRTRPPRTITSLPIAWYAILQRARMTYINCSTEATRRSTCVIGRPALILTNLAVDTRQANESRKILLRQS